MMNTKASATTTLGIAATCWSISVPLMSEIDMGIATPLGSFTSFMVMWILIMAAMMLPGMAPTVFRHVHASRHVSAVVRFVGSYLTVWTLFGLPIYALYQPHGTFIAGVINLISIVFNSSEVPTGDIKDKEHLVQSSNTNESTIQVASSSLGTETFFPANSDIRFVVVGIQRSV